MTNKFFSTFRPAEGIRACKQVHSAFPDRFQLSVWRGKTDQELYRGVRLLVPVGPPLVVRTIWDVRTVLNQ